VGVRLLEPPSAKAVEMQRWNGRSNERENGNGLLFQQATGLSFLQFQLTYIVRVA